MARSVGTGTGARRRAGRRASSASEGSARAFEVQKSLTWTYSFAENAVIIKRDDRDLELAFSRFEHDYAKQLATVVEQKDGSSIIKLTRASIAPQITEVLRLRMTADAAAALAVLIIRHLSTNFGMPLATILSELTAQPAGEDQ